ncbi:cytochrome c biogenesis protein ResB [Corticibacter populi]|uniref:Cytochrome c biogenesis protein ResB n=2 Tax=Corticibacter populi TaxID=1550736 RepID=A0A3M6QPL2_9BURK|nr:cytochrome c biogenesis protein ResB [Corticibacter populi]RMX04977.1 cytochrome c biogenesis protein ResB [Corticibacter populi]RZS33594.1 cytochrome c biogenesis protein [Corticibacter populi]
MHAFWRGSYELLSSMRFAIALLTVICIASVVGTVMRQHEPLVNYVNAFGPFWAELFLTLQLNAVYSAWWFVLILAFLVISTSLCIARNTPKYLAEMRRYKENIRIGSFRAMPFRAEARLAGAPGDLARQLGQALVQGGWKVRLQERGGRAQESGWMVAAKAGSANKIGYIATHGAIVMICLGGLVDGDLWLRMQTWLGNKEPYHGTGMLADVPAKHRLGMDNPSYRGNVMVGEGTRSGTALLNVSNGILLQELPFVIELKKFDVEYYSTGMPRLFASDVIIYDRATGAASEHRIEVNHPLRVHGVDIFQSSFDDGGSRVRLRPVGLTRPLQAEPVDGVIGEQAEVGTAQGLPEQTLEFAELRVLNVENLSEAARGAPGQGVDVRKVDLRSSIDARLGAGNKSTRTQDLRNVGPSITYRLRDASGQAIEFHNYMLPMDLGDGVPVFLLGVRESLVEAFSYLRVPQDQEGGMQSFLGMLQALHNPQQRVRAVDRYVNQAVDDDRPDLQEQLRLSAQRTLDLFAGASASASGAQPAGSEAGLIAVSRFMEQNVPAGELERASEVLLRILNGVLFELLQTSRADADLPALDPADPATQEFMRVAVFSLSDAFFYPEPVVFTLQDFDQVQASVFQVTKAPGRYIVYLGCLFLMVGVFVMLYVRERRLWIWLQAAAGATDGEASQASMAMSSNRKTLESQREFDQLRERLLPDPTPKA